MVPPTFVAYFRVSTQQQGDSGLGLEAQSEIVTRFVESRHGALIGSYTDLLSGRRRDRPQLRLAVAEARSTGSILVVAKLDRLARDTAFILDLLDSGVPVHFCDLPSLSTQDASVSRMVLTVMAAFAEFESRRIGQRVREAVAAARARGKPIKLGMNNPKTKAGFKRYSKVRKAEVIDFAWKIKSQTAHLFRMGKSYADVAGHLNRRGILTHRGKQWTAYNLWRAIRKAI